MYAPHTDSSLLKLKSHFHNSELVSVDKDQDEWVSDLEGPNFFLGELRQKNKIIVEYFMINIQNTLLQKYNVILYGSQNCLTSSSSDMLTNGVIHKN